MSNRQTGGPAFPLHPASTPEMHYTGMTLRDYFAGQSIQTAYKITLSYMPESDPAFEEHVAHHSYAVADKMLKERYE